MRSALIVCLLGLVLGGCTLIAAGVIGASVEREHRDWCRFHPQESNCWIYYRH